MALIVRRRAGPGGCRVDVANAEAEQQRADEDGYEEEEVVDEAVVGVAIPEEIVSTVITIGEIRAKRALPNRRRR